MATQRERLAADGWEVLDDALPEDAGVLELRSSEQLRALADPFRLRLLIALGRQPGSAKQVAERFGVPTTRLYHHLDLLADHGLVDVVATRRSGARTERCYGVRPWSSITPSDELVAGEDFADVLRVLGELVGVGLAESARSGRLQLPLTEDDAPHHVVSWTTVRLTPQQQATFGAELVDLITRIAAAAQANHDGDGPSDDAESTSVFLVLAPDALQPD